MIQQQVERHNFDALRKNQAIKIITFGWQSKIYFIQHEIHIRLYDAVIWFLRVLDRVSLSLL